MASSDHVANSANSDVPLHIEVCMSYRTMQGRLLTLTRCFAMRNKTLRHVGNPMGAKTVLAYTP